MLHVRAAYTRFNEVITVEMYSEILRQTRHCKTSLRKLGKAVQRIHTRQTGMSYGFAENSLKR